MVARRKRWKGPQRDDDRARCAERRERLQLHELCRLPGAERVSERPAERRERTKSMARARDADGQEER